MTDTLQPGALLDNRYRIEALVGEGGFGAVYRAVHVEIGRTVAIKTIKSSETDDPEKVRTVEARFRREARLIGQLRHPSTVTLHDSWMSDGTLYMALEFIEGETLSSVISRQGRIEPPRVAALIDQAAGALAEAHAQGLVHRDVKPPNLILTTAHDGRPLLKLLDFGIAKIVDDARHDTVQTQQGMIIGSPSYMPPEQIHAEAVGPATDQYALAVVAYEMLCGHRPFQGNVRQILIHHIQSPPPPMPAEAGVSEAVQQVLRRALAKEMDARYPDIAAFAADLREAIGGRLPTEPPGLTAGLGETLVLGPATLLDRRPPGLESQRGEPSASFEWRGAVAPPMPPADETRQRRSAPPAWLAIPVLLVLAGLGWALVSLTGATDTVGDSEASAVAAPSDVAPPDAARPDAAPPDAAPPDAAPPDAAPPDAALPDAASKPVRPAASPPKRPARPRPQPPRSAPARVEDAPPPPRPAPPAEPTPAGHEKKKMLYVEDL